MHEAMYYRQFEENMVECLLCPHRCKIKLGKNGVCRARGNREGKLYTLNYAQITSYGVDPIEKKPLYHFYPGASIFSVGTWGCNFRCLFCQNWQIAHGNPTYTEIAPEKLAEIVARENRAEQSCIGIAYTYSEPLMWYEYVLETAQHVHRLHLKNVLVTNGYIREEPLKQLLPYIDAVNLDVKGFQEGYYNKVCGGKLIEVLATAERIKNAGVHLELTMLLVSNLNDSLKEVKEFIQWVKSIDREIPVHFSRYYPNYKMKEPPTPLETLLTVREIAREQLPYVYIGNVGEPELQDTFCPNCRERVVSRSCFHPPSIELKGGECPQCGYKVLPQDAVFNKIR